MDEGNLKTISWTRTRTSRTSYLQTPKYSEVMVSSTIVPLWTTSKHMCELVPNLRPHEMWKKEIFGCSLNVMSKGLSRQMPPTNMEITRT